MFSHSGHFFYIKLPLPACTVNICLSKADYKIDGCLNLPADYLYFFCNIGSSCTLHIFILSFHHFPFGEKFLRNWVWLSCWHGHHTPQHPPLITIVLPDKNFNFTVKYFDTLRHCHLRIQIKPYLLSIHFSELLRVISSPQTTPLTSLLSLLDGLALSLIPPVSIFLYGTNLLINRSMLPLVWGCTIGGSFLP